MKELVQNSNGRNLLARLRHSQQWLEISGYHVGDIQSNDEPVAITSGSTIVGNIFAPEVSINGLVSGSVVAKKTTIKKDGQVWGDLFTINLTLESGGKLQGWISSVDEETYEALSQTQQLPDDITNPNIQPQSDNPNDTNFLNNCDDLELAAYHLLQTEVAITKAARIELEHHFDKRLSEVAGDSSSTIASLNTQIDNKLVEITQLTKQLDTSQSLTQQQKIQIERHQKDLAASQEFIQDQSKKITQKAQQHKQITEQLETLQGTKSSVDQQLHTSLQTIETQSERIHSIETAMHSSLQHSSDLEESLVRWQELAEVTEKKVQELEQTLAGTQFQIKENNKVMDMLREQKQQAEDEWQKAQSELHSMRQTPTKPLEPDSQATKEMLAEASAQLVNLEAELTDLAQERAEQILWYRASLETTQVELAEVRQQLENEQAEKEGLTREQEKLFQQIDKWEEVATTLREKLKRRNDQLKSWRQEASAETQRLNTSLKQKTQQLEASEDDLNYHLQELEKQSRHLAEIQSVLSERELQLRQVKALLLRQNQMMKTLRQKAEAHIRSLQTKS